MKKSVAGKLTPVQRAFIEHCIEECRDEGVTVRLYARERVADGALGVFDEDDRTLTVALGSPDWLVTFFHEYSHFHQWLDGVSTKTVDKAYTDLWLWLDGHKEFTKKQLDTAIRRVVGYERDCERRVVQLMKAYPELELCPKVHGQRANAYLFFYAVVGTVRKWYKNPPHLDPDIVAEMPTTVLADHRNPDQNYIQAVRERCL